jgi:hypothetical protein
LATDLAAQVRGENVDYQTAKLDDLVKKFSDLTTEASSAKQASLALLIAVCRRLISTA